MVESKGQLPLVWSASYEVDIGVHVFPTAKYRLVREALLESGSCRRNQVLTPDPVSWDVVEGAHDAAYIGKIKEGSLSSAEEMVLEVPFSPALREASLLCCGGTLLTAKQALAQGIAVHLGGGFHHAFRDHGEGFCLLNDVAVALTALLAGGEVARAAVVDLDVHHGNGTAAIFASEPRVFTFSMHQKKNYPHPKPPSDLDVGLPDGTRDESYLKLLDEALTRVLEDQGPDLVIYLAGADPFVEDQLGGLALTRGGLEARDRLVLEECRRMGAAVAVVLAGGYARRQDDTIGIHQKTVEVALEAWGEG